MFVSAKMISFLSLVFLGEYLLEDVTSYRYLTYGSVDVESQNDNELYRQLVEAMNIMGITPDEQAGNEEILAS